MRCAPALALLVLSAAVAPVRAETGAALVDCLRAKVVLEDAIILSRQPMGGSISLAVTNNLPFAISGIFVEQVVRSPDRAVPWLTDRVSDFIPGGVEPGETRPLTMYFEGLSDDVPQDVVIEVVLLDVGDPEGNQMVRDTRILGDNWTDKKSERGCT